jgi:hypothetical protein
MVATAATGEIFSRIDTAPGTSPRAAMYKAANAALDQGQVLRDGEVCRIALYNPYSGEASLNAVPATIIYSGGAPISLEPEGSVFELEDDRLVCGDVVLQVVAPSLSRTSRAILSHSF